MWREFGRLVRVCPTASGICIGITAFHLSFTGGSYYAFGIVVSGASPVDHPYSDPHLWIEVAEYLAAVIGAIALAWLIADDLGSPLWGGLTSIRLR